MIILENNDLGEKDRGIKVFDNLDAGDYVIEIQSDGFVTYSQSIHVSSYISKIYVSTGDYSI